MDLSLIRDNLLVIGIGLALMTMVVLSLIFPQIRRKAGLEFTVYPPFVKPYLKFEYEELLKLAIDARDINTVDEVVRKMVLQRLNREFKEYGSYILLRYGSSVRWQVPRDFDYLVLLIGFSDAENRRELSEGSSFRSADPAPLVDINYRDYNSFLFALVAGMPYEHSVIHHHAYIDGDRGYLNWLRALSSNIIIDRDYLIRALSDRIQEFKDTIDNDLVVGPSYSTVIALYFFASTLIQIPYFQALPSELRSQHITPVALPEHLLRIIADPEIHKTFLKIYQYYKRELSIGTNFHFEIQSAYRTMIEYAQEIIQ